jgi:hypothetical protein
MREPRVVTRLSRGRLARWIVPRRATPRPATDHVLPDWTAILDADRRRWDEARRRAIGGPRVLVATSVAGFSALSVVESLLAVALTLRGAQVHTLLCDAALPACLRAEKPEVPDPRVLVDYGLAKALCRGCTATARYLFEPLGLASHWFGELVTDEERRSARAMAAGVPAGEIERYRLDGCAVGEHAHAGALRYFARGTLEGEDLGEPVARRYLEAALIAMAATRRLLGAERFASAVFNHGIYCPQGVIGDVCRGAGVRVVNWAVAYRKRCLLFSHDDTYHHTLLGEPTATWTGLPWTEAMERDILTYLRSRWVGSRDWIGFHEKPDEDFARFAKEAGLDMGRPVVGMLTNVMWDAQLHYRANAFPTMLAWALATVRYFALRPDLQLLIRVHPAEVRGTLPSRQPILAELARAFPVLPPNVFVIPPESPVSTYAAMEACNAAIIYGTKTGVELTSLGIPVIVGGEAWIRGKGLTLDASTPEEYVAILDRLPLAARLAPDVVARARRYAYHFFFRRMIPLAALQPIDGWPPYALAASGLDALVPGADPGLDTICDGILSGTPFVYPAETLGVAGG